MPFFVALGVPFIKLLGITGTKAIAAAYAVGQGIFYGGISIGLGILGRALSPDPPDPQRLAPRNTVRSPTVPERWIVGKPGRTGGMMVYLGALGTIARAAYVLSNGALNRITEIFVRGRKVEFERIADPQGDLLQPLRTSEYWHTATDRPMFRIREYFKADGTQGEHMRYDPYPQPGPDDTWDAPIFYEQDGTQTARPTATTSRVRFYNQNYDATATPLSDEENQEYITEEFYTAFPIWDSSHRLNGVSWVFVEFYQPVWEDVNDRFWQRLPDMEFVCEGLKLTWPGQSTPTYTRNNAAILHWMLTELRNVDPATIDRASFDAAYALCEQDVTVELPEAYSDFSATSKRYAFDYIIESGKLDAANTALNAAWAGQWLEDFGKILMLPGRQGSPVMTLDDSNTVGAPQLIPSRPLEDRINSIECTIPASSAREWTPETLPTFTDTPARNKDGQLRAWNLALDGVTDPIAAARLTAIWLRRTREQRTVSLRVRPGDTHEIIRSLKIGDAVTWGSVSQSYAPAAYTVEGMLIGFGGAVDLAVRQDLPGTFDDTLVLPELKQTNIVVLPDPGTLAVDDPMGLTLVAENVTADDGTTTVQLVATWTVVTAPETLVEWQLRTPDGSGGFTAGPWEPGGDIIGARATRPIPGVAGNVWRVRVAHHNGISRRSNWVVAEVTVTGKTGAPGVPTLDSLTALPGGLLLQWTNPTDPDFDRIEIELTGSTGTATYSTTGNFDSIFNLIPETEYSVRIRALDRTGNESAWTTAQRQTTGRLIQGSKGDDGQPGVGLEFVWTRTPGDVTDIPQNQRPLDAWPYDRPGTTPGGLEWFDEAPTSTPDTPLLWRSQRRVSGSPAPGDPID